MTVRSYPLDDGANVYVNPQWLAMPIRQPGSIANYYISGSGVADFTDDPPWAFKDGTGSSRDAPLSVKFTLKFHRSDIHALTDRDVLFPGSVIAAVTHAHIDRDTPAFPDTPGPWLLALTKIEEVDDGEPPTWWHVEITGEYGEDLWMDKLSYKVGFLVYRPPMSLGWPSSKFAGRKDLVQRLGELLHGP